VSAPVLGVKIGVPKPSSSNGTNDNVGPSLPKLHPAEELNSWIGCSGSVWGR
jgi:hypothetical protein